MKLNQMGFFRVDSHGVALVVVLIILAGVGVSKLSATPGAPGHISSGIAYTETNAPANQVYAYNRGKTGRLTLLGTYSTQGRGKTGSHNTQGALTLSQDRKFLYVTNFGSNDITAFAVGAGGVLTFVGRYSSNGTIPLSVTVHNNWLYVLNKGNPPNITGFLRNADGSLTPLGSTQPLSGPHAGAVGVSFNNHGKVLVVSELTGNNIDTFTVNADGTANAADIQPSAGPGPFGFNFDSADHLFMSEAVKSSMSSYSLSNAGKLKVISGEVMDFGKASCWVANTSNSSFPQQYAYTTNTNSDTISGYSVSATGALTLLDPSNGITYALPAGSHPIDEIVDSSSSYLYVLDQMGQIYVLNINSDGSLTKNSIVSGVPTTSYGLTGD
jgi:6-phosphogluconolactonase (cycloisomerase 2 family)